MTTEQSISYIKRQAETYALRVRAGKVGRECIEGLLRMDAEVASECDDHMERTLLLIGFSEFEAALAL